MKTSPTLTLFGVPVICGLITEPLAPALVNPVLVGPVAVLHGFKFHPPLGEGELIAKRNCLSAYFSTVAELPVSMIVSRRVARVIAT